MGSTSQTTNTQSTNIHNKNVDSLTKHKEVHDKTYNIDHATVNNHHGDDI